MLSTDLLQVAYMLGAAIIGWLVHHNFGGITTSSAPTAPPAGNAPNTQAQPVLSFLQQLTQFRQQSDEILNLLRQFVNGDTKAPPPPAPSSAAGGTAGSH